MSDAMNIARQRRKEHEQAIAKREQEIEDLREMIADLDSFLEFGQELIGGPAPSQRPQSRQPGDPSQAQAQTKPGEPQLKEVQRPSGDDVWEGEAPGKSIANVLAARKA